jgi:CHAD domain-containing protein
MADEKWISGLYGDMPIAKAARHILNVRLGVVLDRLPAAVEHAAEDVEHVHQLRVGTRRAAAALRIFAACLGPKLYRKTRRNLRAIRRAAGAARDWDVFLEMIEARTERPDVKQRRGVDFLLGYTTGQRVSAQGLLGEATRGSAEKLQRRLCQIGAALEDVQDTQTLRDLAVPMLTQLVEEFETTAGADLHAYEALHQVRILGKKLRYAMELFESCFDAAFREELYPKVAEMQEILGRANDSHVAGLHLDELRTWLEQTQPQQWTHYRPGIEPLQRYHRRRLPEQRRLFAKWWSTWESAGQAAVLSELLRSEG